jgi:hypothetical protein
LYEELKQNVVVSGNLDSESVAPQPTGFRRIIGTSGKAEHMLILNVNDPKVIPSINLDVFYGLLNFKEQKDIIQLNDQKPIIAISSSYDALAISPELSFSLENGGSALIAELEMSRIFSQLVSEL